MAWDGTDVCYKKTGMTGEKIYRLQSAGCNILRQTKENLEKGCGKRLSDSTTKQGRSHWTAVIEKMKLEMWAMPNVMAALPNRWRHLFNAAKFGWRPLVECRAVTLPRRETQWNLQGYLKLANRSQPVAGQSSPYYEDMWRRYCCLTSFSDFTMCLSCEDMARQSCAMVPRRRFSASCIYSEPRAARFTPAF